MKKLFSKKSIQSHDFFEDWKKTDIEWLGYLAFCDVTFPKKTNFGTSLDDILKNKMIKAQFLAHFEENK